jgi:predicted TIM-barrel fold metal-dependent hydrolase
MNSSIDCHIHLQSEKVNDLLCAMDHANVSKVILLGSSKFTFTLNPEDGFSHYHKNNLELIRLKTIYPNKFEVFPTLEPTFPDNCNLLRYYISKGASGLKLYVGHGYKYGSPSKYLFHSTQIDSEFLMGIYEICNRERLPICLHVNTTNNEPGFVEEFEHVLATFPTLKILAPHWMLASKRPSFLRKMLEKYENLSTDTSFGQDSFLEVGMKRISENRGVLRKIIIDFPTRFLCGSDVVCTVAPHKTIHWIASRMVTYKLMLSTNNYICPVTMSRKNGLFLPEDVLFKVFNDNAIRLLSK